MYKQNRGCKNVLEANLSFAHPKHFIFSSITQLLKKKTHQSVLILDADLVNSRSLPWAHRRSFCGFQSALSHSVQSVSSLLTPTGPRILEVKYVAD